jgi:DNA polymerase-3 subunit delta'
LPHALLLVGEPGLGKRLFAQAMVARLLCEAADTATDGLSFACGHCSSCRWLAAGNHPDYRRVQPEDADEIAAGSESTEVADEGGAEATPKSRGKTGSKTAGKPAGKSGAAASRHIRIGQIRELADFVFLGSHRHGRRIVVLQPAEAMQAAAANALLKILEEPPSSVCFILISDAWRQLLPTIRSRCRVVNFPRPNPQQATHWLTTEGVSEAESLLKLAGGSPLLARDWAQTGYLDTYRKAIEVLTEKAGDPVQMAARWSVLIKGEGAFDLPQLVEGVQKWLFDLVQIKLAGEVSFHLPWRNALAGLAAKAEVAALLRCHEDLLRIRAVVRHPLNTQLFLEDLAARYLIALR